MDVETAESVRSRVSGLDHVEMKDAEKKLFEESQALQAKISQELRAFDESGREGTPEITQDMRRVIKIALILSGKEKKGIPGLSPAKPSREVSPAALKARRSEASGASLNQTNYGCEFSYGIGLNEISTRDAGPQDSWAASFNALIDLIDRKNNQRFVS